MTNPCFTNPCFTNPCFTNPPFTNPCFTNPCFTNPCFTNPMFYKSNPVHVLQYARLTRFQIHAWIVSRYKISNASASNFLHNGNIAKFYSTKIKKNGIIIIAISLAVKVWRAQLKLLVNLLRYYSCTSRCSLLD